MAATQLSVVKLSDSFVCHNQGCMFNLNIEKGGEELKGSNVMEVSLVLLLISLVFVFLFTFCWFSKVVSPPF